jgi:peptide/nickel transport system ATP-binding protein/oligopeptide transport system ATP-binding protein
MESKNLLEIKNLRTSFYVRDHVAKAVDDVSLSIQPGQTLGLVGESGCGKSVTAHSIIQLIPIPPGKIEGGQIFFEGKNLLEFPESKMRKIRGNRISMIFQEPMTSLNPVFSVGDQVAEVIRLHQRLSRGETRRRVIEMFQLVGISAAEARLSDYPQILDLMNKLKTDTGAAILFITHDLGVIAEMAQNVAVMYAGKVMEYTDVKSLYADPKNPYTIGLLQSIPVLGSKTKGHRLETISGVVPSLFNLPAGCLFSDRCPAVFDDCRRVAPEMYRVGKNHLVRCLKYA